VVARRAGLALAVGAAMLCLAAAGAAAQPMSRAQAMARAEALGTLGRMLFLDPRLSGSGQLSCASCHSPAHAFGPPNALPVQFGGGNLQQPGVRAVPSLKYLQAVPQFTEHFFESEDEGDESIDNGPTGGLTWDGRVASGHAQARIPLLSPFEMANVDAGQVVDAALHAGYGPAIEAIEGPDVLADRNRLFQAVLKALEVYQQDWRAFYPYSSKYDAYLAGKAALTPQEARGLAAFEDPARGNCAACHISRRADDGTPPQFTDYGMIVLAVPRNPAIPANADPAYFDLGLCGPYRADLVAREDYCGRFRTPSLRNVATRASFFHNGVLHSLRDAVAFYATRDTDPGRWYPRRPDGSIAEYDDLPSGYWANINREAPFGGRPGGVPALSDTEIDDIVAFLQTLTDGWPPAAAPHRSD
jgi:cytochrome c peroxidase